MTFAKILGIGSKRILTAIANFGFFRKEIRANRSLFFRIDEFAGSHLGVLVLTFYCQDMKNKNGILDVPTLTIVITVWNLHNYLADIFSSIQNQTVFPDQLLIIDDGSTDGSYELVKTLVKNLPNTETYQLPHGGVSHARNFAIQKITSKYVLFFDGDDFFEPQSIEKIYASLSLDPDVLVVGANEFYNTSGLKLRMHWINKLSRSKNGLISFQTIDIYNAIFSDFMGWAWDKVFKTELICQHHLKFPPLHNSEDLVFVYKALLLSKNITVDPTSLINHRVGRFKSLSNSRSIYSLDSYEAIKNLHAFFQSPSYPFDKASKSFNEWAADFSIWALKDSVYTFPEIEKKTPLIDWKEIKSTKSAYFPYLNLLVKIASHNHMNNIWKIVYSLYILSKYGIRRILFFVFSKYYHHRL